MPLTIPRIKISADFGHLILLIPYFQFLYFLFLVSVLATTKFANCKQVYYKRECLWSVPLGIHCLWVWQACGAQARPVVPLTGLWCLWSGLGRPVVAGAPARPLVLLTGLRCPWKDCGAPDKPEVPTTGPWCP